MDYLRRASTGRLRPRRSLRRSCGSRCSGTGCPRCRAGRRRIGVRLRGSSRWLACTIMPGVQKPHCTAPFSTKALRRRCAPLRRPGPRSSPARGRRNRAANIRQELTDAPSTRMVQAPHSPSPQPYLVPVRPSTSRSISSALMPAADARAPLHAVQREARCHSLSDMASSILLSMLRISSRAVPGAGAHVGDRRGFLGGACGSALGQRGVEHAAFEHRFGAARAHRRRRHRAECDPHVAAAAGRVATRAERDRDRRDVQRRARACL